MLSKVEVLEIRDFSSASSARLSRNSAVKLKRNTLAYTAAIIAIILLATFLRLHLLDAQSFWNDEGNTARLSERSIALIIEGTASDIHPPLYYILLRGWRELVGESEFALRAFSAFVGVLTIPVVIALGWMIAGKRPYLVALIAGLATTVNPALIYYSQEARMYALLGFLATLSTLLLVKWLRASFRFSLFSFQSVVWAGAYVLCATAGLYTQYFFPTVLVAHNLIVLFILIRLVFNKQQSTGNSQQGTSRITHHASRIFLSWCAIMILTFLLYLPWLPIFIGNFGSDVVGSGQPVLPYVRDMIWWMAFGRTLPFVGWAFAVVLLLIGIGIFQGRKQAVLPSICLAIPMLFIVVGSTTPELFKFLVVAVPFMMLLVGLGFDEPQRTRRSQRGKVVVQVVSVILLASLLFPTVQSLNNLYNNPEYARADYRGMVQRIFNENRENGAVILNAPNQWEVFTYYYPDTAVFPMPEGLRYEPVAAIDAWVEEIAAEHERIYLVLWGETEWDPERRIERWLDAHAFKATDEWFKDVRFVTYAIPSMPATEMETKLGFAVGDEGIVLDGFTLANSELGPSDIIEVTLFWETPVSLSTRNKIFLHLLDANGQLVAQRDSEPGGGLALTTTWQPNEQIIDNHGILIPNDLPAGEYTLTVGMYDIADPATRLAIETKNGEMDAYPLATITVQ